MAEDGHPTIEGRLDALPSIPLTLAHRRGEGDGADLERILPLDPAFAVMVLRVANSPLYGRGATVTSISAAQRLLGPGVLKRIASGIATLDAFPDGEASDIAAGRSHGLEHAIATAAVAESLAKGLGTPSPEEAWTAGLVHDLGRLVLDAQDAARYAKVDARAAEEKRPISDVETEMLGSDHGRLGALVAERWNLPPGLRSVMEHHHATPDRLEALDESVRALVQVVAAADIILAQNGFADCGGLEATLPVVAGRTIDGALVAAAVSAARGALEEARERLGLVGAKGAGLAALIGDAARETALQDIPAGMLPRPELRHAAEVMTSTLRELRGLATAEEAWEAGLKGIKLAMGVDRVLFFNYDAERARLALRHGIDDTGLLQQAEKPLKDLPLAPGGALAHAVRDGNAAMVDDPTVDGDFLKGVGIARVVAAPVDVLNRTHGVLTADNLFCGRTLGESDASLLELIATELGLAVENLMLQKQTQKLRALAERDELTGVNNRRNLMKLFQRELDRARRYGSNLSVAMVDIDHFKGFNDTYGHQAGDDVLRTISQVLVSASREIDIIGRYGGEEFMALLPETDIEQSKIYSERLRRMVELRGQELAERFDRTGPLTISVGVSQARVKDDEEIESIVARVDAALYDAKEKGRNCVVIVDAEAPE